MRSRSLTPIVDLDLCARAIEAGYRNYYFGTLSAVEHGPDRLDLPREPGVRAGDPEREARPHARHLAAARCSSTPSIRSGRSRPAPAPSEPVIVEVAVVGPEAGAIQGGRQPELGPQARCSARRMG